MNKLIAVLLASCLAVPAWAADNTIAVTVGSGVTLRTKDIGSGVQSSVVIPGDTSGNPIYGTAGSANSNVLTVQGIASGTAQPVSGTFFQATQPVSVASGGVASGGISAGAMVDLLTMRGSLAGGTAAANSIAVGGVYNSSAPTLTTGQQASFQFDVNGNVKVVGIGVAAGSTTSGQTMSPVGCATTTSAPSNSTAQTNFLSCDTGGALRTATASTATVGAAPPASATYLGANASGATGGLVAGLIQCDSKAIYDASTGGSTELVALTSGRSIYVCGYSIMAGGTVNVKLIYGTGTACATGSNNLTPAWQLTAQAGISDPSPFYRGMKTASANALCINASGAVAAQAIVYYSII